MGVPFHEPLSVATSLCVRNGFSINSGLVIWFIYNYHIASQLNSNDLLVFYDSLLRLGDSSQNSILLSKIDAFLERQGFSCAETSSWQKLPQVYLRLAYNRADQAISSDSRSQVNPFLMKLVLFVVKSCYVPNTPSSV